MTKKHFMPWDTFKAWLDATGASIVEQTKGTTYLLEAQYNNTSRACKIKAHETVAKADYENNYQNKANPKLLDSDGMPIGRTKITQSGWHYQLYGLEFETAKKNSMVNIDINGEDLSHTSMKFYNNNDEELTTQLSIDLGCVKTVIDWEPPWDYEIIGGQFRQLSVPGSDVRLHVVAVPDIPAEQGGSVPFVNGVNLRYLGSSDMIRTDGRTSKKLNYNATYHTNKIRIIVEHGILMTHKMHLMLEIFRA